MHVRARVASVRTTPSRSEDVERITRVTVDVHDMPLENIGWLSLQNGKTIGVEFGAPPALPPTPLEEFIDAAADDEPEDGEASDEYIQSQVEVGDNGHTEVDEEDGWEAVTNALTPVEPEPLIDAAMTRRSSRRRSR